MRHIFTAVAVVTLLLIGGCGGEANTPDPFVGTWTDPELSYVKLTIQKQQGTQYVAAASKGGQTLALTYTRDGNRLTAVELPAGHAARPVIVYDPGTGTLQFTPFGKNVTLIKSGTP